MSTVATAYFEEQTEEQQIRQRSLKTSETKKMIPLYNRRKPSSRSFNSIRNVLFILIFIPYISSCIQSLFPDAQLARELGVSVLDISEKSKLNRIELNTIKYEPFFSIK